MARGRSKDEQQGWDLFRFDPSLVRNLKQEFKPGYSVASERDQLMQLKNLEKWRISSPLG
jgi:hypothetical protein